MTVEDIKQESDKNPSDELTNMVVDYIHTSVRQKDIVQYREQLVTKILDKASTEGISNDKIREMIITEFTKMQLSDRTIQRYLPDQLKDKTKQQASLMRKTIGNKKVETDHTVSAKFEGIQPKSVDDTVSTSIDESSDTEIFNSTEIEKPTIEWLEQNSKQGLVEPVYKEPDRVEPRPEWNKEGQTVPEIEQSFTTDKGFHTMNVPDKSQIPTSEWLVHNEPTDYTVTTQLQIYNGTGNNIGQFTTDITVHCSPKDKSVTVEPIDKSSIRKVR